jgi:hypothetical protein
MMNVQLKPQEFHSEAARKALSNAIGIRLAAARDVETIGITIADAERRIDKLKEGLQEFSTLMDRVSEAASNALRDGAELETPPGLLEAKARNQKLLADIEFATAGLDSLKAQLEQKRRDLDVLTARAKETAEPLIVAEGEDMAGEVARLESLAAVARAKLFAFSHSGQGGQVQRLGPNAYTVLRDKPPNCTPPMTNTDLWRRTQSFKKSVIDFRNALEQDAGVQLYFLDEEG